MALSEKVPANIECTGHSCSIYIDVGAKLPLQRMSESEGILGILLVQTDH